MSTSESYRLLKSLDKISFTLLEDKTRRNVLQLLRENELTVKDIANSLNMTPQNIYHHLKKLLAAGLILEVNERRSGHIIESYYTASADTFVYYEDELPSNDSLEFIEVLNGLNELGVDVEVTEENAGRLADLYNRKVKILESPDIINSICSICSLSGYFMKFGPMNPLLLSRIIQYQNMINLSDEEFEETMKIARELRATLFSMKKN